MNVQNLNLDEWIKDSYLCENSGTVGSANVSDIADTLKETLSITMLEYLSGGASSVTLTEEQLKDLYYQTCEDVNDSEDFLVHKILDFLDESNFCYSVNTEDGEVEEINCSQRILFFEFSGDSEIIIDI